MSGSAVRECTRPLTFRLNFFIGWLRDFVANKRLSANCRASARRGHWRGLLFPVHNPAQGQASRGRAAMALSPANPIKKGNVAMQSVKRENDAMQSVRLCLLSALLLGLALPASAADIHTKPPADFKKVSTLVKLPDYLPGLGVLYVDPS